ncbi:hypothetical protein AMECASPLE_013486 [Ameca splendens]|uniref:Uncharacterized protein n=1 Tax=Ameca splendens TaxID=208324 RepID=A0ABV0ZL51_9TELE
MEPGRSETETAKHSAKEVLAIRPLLLQMIIKMRNTCRTQRRSPQQHLVVEEETSPGLALFLAVAHFWRGRSSKLRLPTT